ncbi:hypothetical protein HQN84_13965 [Pedobacter steynii]|nr:hypothetical protein [Pedobacter steynii]NQX39957.1 hypothetical protein [Pedobacter steynii]
MTSKKIPLNIVLILFTLSLPACVSRLARPEIRGIIMDYNRKPLVNCKVGETTTAKDGSFLLPERRYHKFLLSEMFIMEAPPLMVMERIEKEGFEPDEIYTFNRYGGGNRRGAKYNVDTLFLKKTDQQFDLLALLKNKTWKLSATKNADTLYLIRSDFNSRCKTRKCQTFYNSYSALTDNYSLHTSPGNLPEAISRRDISLTFKADQAFDYKQVQNYRTGHKSLLSNTGIDSLQGIGKWNIKEHNTLQLDLKDIPIANQYRATEIEDYKLLLIRSGI